MSPGKFGPLLPLVRRNSARTAKARKSNNKKRKLNSPVQDANNNAENNNANYPNHSYMVDIPEQVRFGESSLRDFNTANLQMSPNLSETKLRRRKLFSSKENICDELNPLDVVGKEARKQVLSDHPAIIAEQSLNGSLFNRRKTVVKPRNKKTTVAGSEHMKSNISITLMKHLTRARAKQTNKQNENVCNDTVKLDATAKETRGTKDISKVKKILHRPTEDNTPQRVTRFGRKMPKSYYPR